MAGEWFLLSNLEIGKGCGQNAVTRITGAGLSLCHDQSGTAQGGEGGGVS